MKYRKKPIEVEAFYIEKYPKDVAPEFYHEKFPKKLVPKWVDKFCEIVLSGHRIGCMTKSGYMVVALPTWLILEADGEGCYPCSPEMFEKLYEKVD